MKKTFFLSCKNSELSVKLTQRIVFFYGILKKKYYILDIQYVNPGNSD